MIPAIEHFKEYLTNVHHMDADSFELCTGYLEVAEVNKGDYLIREGQRCDHVFYIDSGLFRIFYLKDGIEVNTCFCTENSITSSFESFVSRNASSQSIQALENASVVKISYDHLKKLYAISPAWQSLGLVMTEKECLRLSYRTTSLSFETASEKYKTLLENEPELLLRVPIQHIASYLGVTRETLSRIRSKFN